LTKSLKFRTEKSELKALTNVKKVIKCLSWAKC